MIFLEIAFGTVFQCDIYDTACGDTFHVAYKQSCICRFEPDKNAYNISIIYLINGQNNVAQFDTILKRLR